MTIKEVEAKTALSRSNIRFYEKEKLISPIRNETNGYREYSEENVETIKRIGFLRTLGFSIDDIRKILKEEISLGEGISNQYKKLSLQIAELQTAKSICDAMMQEKYLDINTLDINIYINGYSKNIREHWQKHSKIFKLDSIRFIHIWSGFITWGAITLSSLLLAIFTYPFLPKQIPIQWDTDKVTSSVSKEFIFIYPLFCMLVPFVLKPMIETRLHQNGFLSKTVTNYISNFLCFIAFSIELFTFLFLQGILHNIGILLLVNGGIFMAILVIGWRKYSLP